MPNVKQAIGLNSPFVRHVSLTTFTGPSQTPMHPDGCWDIAILKHGDDVQVLRTGLTTRTVTHVAEEGDEILAITFNPDTFMPLMPGERMLDEGVILDKIGRDRFWLGTDVVEIPNFDNVDVFIERLLRREIVQSNEVVTSIVSGRPMAMSERTMQRHFLRTTGLTYKSFTQIERARKAMALLQVGRPAADVAFALGYADQPHMIRSLKAIMGQTPRRIAEAGEPQSVGFLQSSPLRAG
jgi:hypothetical protein